MRPLTTVGRLALASAGLFVILGGIIAWSLETQYGAGTNWTVESSGETERLYHVNEDNIGPDGQPGTTFFFEGTREEMRDFIAEYESGRRDYTLATTVLAVGALVVALSASYPLLSRN